MLTSLVTIVLSYAISSTFVEGSGLRLPAYLAMAWPYVQGAALIALLGICVLLCTWLRGRKTSREAATLAGQLEAVQHQLREREKLASLGQLTAGIAHEIKNPLNFVTNFAELSQELIEDLRAAKTEEERGEILVDLQRNIDKISEHGYRAAEIVRGMMLQARQGTPVREAVDINALISESVHLAYHSMRAQQDGFNCSIDLELDETLPRPKIERQAIARVLLNIAQNAMQAVHEKQKSAGPGYDPRILLRSSIAEDAIIIALRDNGPGIPPRIKSRVFDPFFTTKTASEGTGLGLTIAHDIVVQEHGGRLTVHDVPNGGTEFIIQLPLAPLP